MPLPDSAVEDDRLPVVDPRAFGERRGRGLRHLRVVLEAELLEPLDDREARVDQPAALAALGALLVLCLEQGREVGGRRLLLAGSFLGERPEAALDRRQLELGGVRFDERLERRGLRVASAAHRPPPISAS